MVTSVSKLKLILLSEDTHQPVPSAEVYWDKIPEGVRNNKFYCQQYENSENGLLIDVSNRAGFTLLWGKLANKNQRSFYLHKIVCTGFNAKDIKKRHIVKGGSEREITVFLTPDNGQSK